MLDIFDIQNKLISVRSQSGRENAAADVIRSLVEPFADDIRTDGMGSLIVRKKGPEGAKKLLFAAHMDEIGFVVTHIEDDGFLRFANVGGFSFPNIVGARVMLASGAAGVVHINADVTKDVRISDLFIDIGAKDRAEAEKLAHVGDVGGYNLPPVAMGDCVTGAYMDDKICCSALIAALSALDKPQNDVYFAFTVQEEVGCRGAAAAANGVAPDAAIVVDVTWAAVPGSPKGEGAELRKGPSNKIFDGTLICAPAVREYIASTAAKAGIELQDDLLTLGGTDGGNMQRTGTGVPTGGVSIPTRYVHSPVETVSRSDAENTAKLIALLAAGDISSI